MVIRQQPDGRDSRAVRRSDARTPAFESANAHAHFQSLMRSPLTVNLSGRSHSSIQWATKPGAIDEQELKQLLVCSAWQA